MYQVKDNSPKGVKLDHVFLNTTEFYYLALDVKK